MANYDRGVYEPSDDVRVFDGAEEEDDVEGSRLPLVIVLALLVLAMFGGVVWLAYTQGVARGRGETPVLTAASGPERVAPPGGAGTVPYQGFKIYEQPAPPDDEAADSAPAPQTAPKSAPLAEAPKPVPQATVVAPPKPAPVASAPAAPPPPKPAAMAATPKPAPAPTPAAAKPATPPKSVAALIQQANSTPEPVKPVAKPATPPMKQAVLPPPPVSTTATGAPRQLGAATAPTPKVAAATALPTSAPAPVKAAATGGGFVLQIGAYKSQGDAEAAWKDYKARHSALLAGYSDDVQQADLGAKGTWYRLRIGGLADREVAVALCDRLKADGGACILGR
jgi:cell division septation protein DedD